MTIFETVEGFHLTEGCTRLFEKHELPAISTACTQVLKHFPAPLMPGGVFI
jgi:hypothetical protein